MVSDNNDDGLATADHTLIETDDHDDDDKLNDIYGAPSTSIEVDVPSDPEDSATTYIVNIEPDGEELFLIISDVSIKEKDILNGRYLETIYSMLTNIKSCIHLCRTKTKWTLDTLESCERVRDEVLRMNFDTINKDKMERTYRVEKELCQVCLRRNFHFFFINFSDCFVIETGIIFTWNFIETSIIGDESNVVSLCQLFHPIFP